MISAGSLNLYNVGRGREPVYAFVDADNIKHGLERALRVRSIKEDDYPLFDILSLLRTAMPTDRYYIYSSIDPETGPPNWIAEIRSQDGFIFRDTRLTRKGSKIKQEGVDVALAVEAMQCATKRIMRHCTIFSGDGDLLPLINALVTEGISTAGVSFDNPEKSDVAARMRDASDEFYQIGTSILRTAYHERIFKGGSDYGDDQFYKNLGDAFELDVGFDKYTSFGLNNAHAADFAREQAVSGGF